jgi:isopentenyl-diphosphate delta-isomerase
MTSTMIDQPSVSYNTRMTDATFVNKDDEIIGYGHRTEAIEKGLIHRIARIFVFNSKGELLIQKRSQTTKLPGRWDQSAAGHVKGGEDYLAAATREAEEEIGLKDIALEEFGKLYTEETDEAVVKKRFNTIFTATFDGSLKQDDDEVSEIQWIDPNELQKWMVQKPDDFTQGFLLSFAYYMNGRGIN